jgi:AGZA family xanthine/uracil permease-like MFS transporter
VAGLTGGVGQTTPYIGHPAYKAMGARLGYTVFTGVFVGLGGMLGYISFIVELIPRAVLAPVLIFVALQIMAQAFVACPPRHAPAVSFAYLPTIARLLQIKLSNPEMVDPATFLRLLNSIGKSLPELQVLVALGNGFILTAMLWGGLVASLIDHKFRSCSIYLLILAVMSFFGIIHSATPDGNMYWPWTLSLPARLIPYQFSLSYLVLALVVAALTFYWRGQKNNSIAERIPRARPKHSA